MRDIFLVFMILVGGCLCADARTVLVTGGAGYIGSHTCKVLKEAGFIPVTYDSLDLGDKDSVKWGPLVIGNLLDTETLDQAFTDYKPFAVIHFAGLRNVGESVKDPKIYYNNNLVGSIHLLNAMIKHQVNYIIFSSSCTVYGDGHTGLISEESSQKPTNPYAMSKYAVERIIKDYAHAYPLKYMILRYFNAAGVDIDAGLRRSVHSLNFLIPRALLAILHPISPLHMFGIDYPTPDGTPIRDYIHVKDLANAHILALNHLQASQESNEINLGTGKGYSVYQVLNTIEKITGKPVPREIKPRREGDVLEAVADVKKAGEVLHFHPQFSDLETIIESEWNSLNLSR